MSVTISMARVLRTNDTRQPIILWTVKKRSTSSLKMKLRTMHMIKTAVMWVSLNQTLTQNQLALKCVEKNGQIHSETVQNAAELVADLCKRYGLSTDKIVRHYDVTNKSCPTPWVSDSSQLAAFRKKVDALLGNKTVSKATSSTSQSSKTTGIILKKGSSGSKVKALQKRLIAAGFSLSKYGADGSYGMKRCRSSKLCKRKRVSRWMKFTDRLQKRRL